MQRVLLLAIVFGIAASPASGAGETFGVPVYPGAATDDATVAYCTTAAMHVHMQVQGKGLEADVVCYRAHAPFSRVVEFFKKQPSLQLVVKSESGPKTALFCARGPRCSGEAGGVQVQINSPWKAGKTEMRDVVVAVSAGRKPSAERKSRVEGRERSRSR